MTAVHDPAAVDAERQTKQTLLDVRGLKTHFQVGDRVAEAVNGVSFDIKEGEILGLVGESGSGKSVTAMSLLKLIPNPPGRIVAGEVLYKGEDLAAMEYEEIRKYRGREIAMIFQEPMTALNPVFNIGMQIAEGLIHHLNMPKKEALDRAVEMLDLVGIPDGRRRLKQYPHQFSGGMRQRVMIAIALALEPSLLIADEPTTALDVTIQAQILELMIKIKDKRGEGSILLITHDLAVVAETCHRVAVMYGGKIQEIADVVSLFKNPAHPYTRGLLSSLPRPDLPHQKKAKLDAIPGMVPSVFDFPQGCKFCNRCAEKIDICETVEPELISIGAGRQVRCHLHSDETAAAGASS